MEHKEAKRGLAVIFTIFLIGAGISLSFAIIGHQIGGGLLALWFGLSSLFAAIVAVVAFTVLIIGIFAISQKEG